MQKSIIVTLVAMAVLMMSFQETVCFTGGGILGKRSQVRLLSCRKGFCHVLTCYLIGIVTLKWPVIKNVMSCCVRSCRVRSCWVLSCHVRSCREVLCCVQSCLPNHIISSYIMSYQIGSNHALFYPVKSCRVLACHIVTSCRFVCSVLPSTSYTMLGHTKLDLIILSCHVVSLHVILSCHVESCCTMPFHAVLLHVV